MTARGVVYSRVQSFTQASIVLPIYSNKHLLSKIFSFSDYRKFENWGNFGKCRDARRKKIHS